MTDSKTIGAIGGIISVVALVIVAVFAISKQPAAQITLGGSDQSGLSVNGTGSVVVIPDVAGLELGVEVIARTVAQARSSAAEVMDEIMASLNANGVDKKDVQTRYLSIYPQYSYKNESAPEITGFTVSNQVTITVRELDTVSAVLDDAIAAGGDFVRVNGISFTVDDPDQYLDEAREKAVANAREHADTLARAAGVSVGGVRSISESSGGYYPPEPRYALEAADSGGSTSIAAGEQELTMSVSVVFDID
jgi:uncharacterized protein YggE